MSGLTGAGNGTSTFGSVHFWLVQSGGPTLPRIGVISSYARKKLPYGNNAIVELGGQDRTPIQRQILIKTVDVVPFQALVNSVATLTIKGTSYGSCALVLADTPEEYQPGYSTLTAKWEF